MADQEEAVQQSPEFRNRRPGLIAFGVLEVMFGLFCSLMVPLMVFGMMMAATVNKGSAPPMGADTMAPALLFYGLLAVWFIWMGIGSIQARRWARALWLVSSWGWLITGINGAALVLLFMPDFWSQMGESGQMPSEMVVVMKYVMAGFLALFYVIIPGALVLFYGSKHVKATCELRDPQVRWTDKCPLPVLGMSLLFGVWAVLMPCIGLYGWAVPFFGVVLSGFVGALVALVVMSLCAYAAWGTYRLDLKAWWCSLVLAVTWTLSAGITFSRVGMLEFYEKMGFPEAQMEMMKQFTMPQGATMALIFSLWVAPFLGFLLYTKRFFGVPSQQ